MSETNPPPVAPVEGHYALLRNGNVVGPLEKSCIEGFFSCQVGYEIDEWQADGRFFAGSCDLDIIATISPEAMQAVASGEFERLRAALDDIFEMWAGSEGFIPHTASEGYLLMLIKKMADRAALAKTEESK